MGVAHDLMPYLGALCTFFMRHMDSSSSWVKVMMSLRNIDTLGGGRYLAKSVAATSFHVVIVSLGKK